MIRQRTSTVNTTLSAFWSIAFVRQRSLMTTGQRGGENIDPRLSKTRAAGAFPVKQNNVEWLASALLRINATQSFRHTVKLTLVQGPTP